MAVSTFNIFIDSGRFIWRAGKLKPGLSMNFVYTRINMLLLVYSLSLDLSFLLFLSLLPVGIFSVFNIEADLLLISCIG